MKNQQIVFLFVLMITSSEFLITSNALRLQPSFVAHSLSLHDTRRSEAPEVLLQTLAESNDQLAASPGTAAQTLTQAGNAITGIKNVADGLKDLMKGTEETVKKFTDAVKGLTALGGAFSALGGVFATFDLILSIGQKSDLEKIIDRIDLAEKRIREDIENAVETLTLQSRKNDFKTAESKIRTAHEHLQKMQESKKKKNQADFKYQKEQFINDAKNTEDYIQEIYDAYQPSWSQGEPIFELIMKKYDGDWSKVTDALEVMTLWILQAQLNYIAYLGVANKQDLIPGVIKDSQQKLNFIAKYAATLPKKNFNLVYQIIGNTLIDTVKEKCESWSGDSDAERNNQACADAILAHYQQKYPTNYLLFTVIVYADYRTLYETDWTYIGRRNVAGCEAQGKIVLVYFTMAGGCKQMNGANLHTRLSSSDFTKMAAKDQKVKQEFYCDVTLLAPKHATSYKIDNTDRAFQGNFWGTDWNNFGFSYKLDPKSPGPCFWNETTF